MKKIVALCSVLMLLMVGCAQTEQIVHEVPESAEHRFNGISADEIKIITDSETGCKYIFVNDGTGNYRTTAMSPLMKYATQVDCGQK